MSEYNRLTIARLRATIEAMEAERERILANAMEATSYWRKLWQDQLIKEADERRTRNDRPDDRAEVALAAERQAVRDQVRRAEWAEVDADRLAAHVADARKTFMEDSSMWAALGGALEDHKAAVAAVSRRGWS